MHNRYPCLIRDIISGHLELGGSALRGLAVRLYERVVPHLRTGRTFHRSVAKTFDQATKYIGRQYTDRFCWNYYGGHLSFTSIQPIGSRQLPAISYDWFMLQSIYVITISERQNIMFDYTTISVLGPCQMLNTLIVCLGIDRLSIFFSYIRLWDLVSDPEKNLHLISKKNFTWKHVGQKSWRISGLEKSPDTGCP